MDEVEPTAIRSRWFIAAWNEDEGEWELTKAANVCGSDSLIYHAITEIARLEQAVADTREIMDKVLAPALTGANQPHREAGRRQG